MNDGSFNSESPREPGWRPRSENIQNVDVTSKSNLFLENTRRSTSSRIVQIEGRGLQILGAGIIAYSSIISPDLRATIAGALLISAGRIAQRYFR